jgi:hypothetical protein
MARGRPFQKTKEIEVVTAEYILSRYPVNRRWIENHSHQLKPFKVAGSRLNFYDKAHIDSLFQPQEA